MVLLVRIEGLRGLALIRRANMRQSWYKSRRQSTYSPACLAVGSTRNPEQPDESPVGALPPPACLVALQTTVELGIA